MNEEQDSMISEGLNQSAEEAAEKAAAAGTSQQEPDMRFDPETGRPMTGTVGAALPEFQKMEEKPPKKNRNKLWIALGAAVVFLALIFAVVKSGIFLSDSEKIARALTNTVSYQSHLVKDLRALSVLALDNYTIGIDADIEGSNIGVHYHSSPDEKQVTGSMNVFFFPSMDLIVSLTPSQARMQIPGLEDRILVYNYMEEKTGYITEMFTKEELEEIDAGLKSLFEENNQKDASMELVKAITKWYHSLEFEKAEGKEFQVNGQKRQCTGYKLAGVNEHILDVLDEVEDIFNKYYEEEMETAGFDEIFEELRDMFDYVDMDLIFYLYRNQVACIAVEADGEELQVLFESDKKGNLKVEYILCGDTLIQIERVITDSAEKYAYHIPEESYYSAFDMELEYNFESGDISLELEDYDSYVLKGNLESDAERAVLTIDTIEYEGEDTDMSFEIFVEKGASLQKMEGEEVDLGSLSESGWEELEDLSWF